MTSAQNLRCPVCRATFRQTVQCSRCGADLTVLMTLVAQAHVLRQQARASLSKGLWPQGLAMAEQAQALHATPQGERLRLLAVWCGQHVQD